MKDNKLNYRIFRVEKLKDSHLVKKITMDKIYAKDHDDAYAQLKDYIKVANKQYKYYVEPWSQCIVIYDDKKVYGDDFEEVMEKRRSMVPPFRRALDEAASFFRYWFGSFPRDIYYKIRDIVYLLKTKQQYSTSWRIDEAMLELMLHNLPILLENKMSYSWAMIDKALIEKHKGDKNFDIEAYRKDPAYYDSRQRKDVRDRALVLEREMLNGLIDDIKTYLYYMREDYVYVDPNDKEMVELDKKLRPTLPLIKGSYDTYDYHKLNAMQEKIWNRIWDTVRKYGREFND